MCLLREAHILAHIRKYYLAMQYSFYLARVGGGLIHFWTFEGRGVLEMGCMGLIERGGLFTNP